MYKLLAACSLAILLTSCGGAVRWDSPESSVTRSPPRTSSTSARATTRSVTAQPVTLNDQLTQHYQDWQGVPYRWGGQSRNGIDCSAFVQQTLQSVMGLDLPRTTELQRQKGYGITASNAIAGDLVFFKTGKNVQHVGVYMGSNKFLHASQSKGVAISRTDDTYWQPRVVEYRRVR